MDFAEQVNTIAVEANRKAAFRQVLHDMRRYAKVCCDHADANGKGWDIWDVAYAHRHNIERRLRLRYDEETLFRMKQVIIRTHRIHII